MPTIDTGDLRKGITLEISGELCKIIDYQHVKRGRGTAFVRLQLRNLRSGATTEETFMAGSKFEQAYLERRTVQFLYRDGPNYYFMDTETYEQPVVSEDILGDTINYLRENDSVSLLTHEGEVLDVELPPSVVLQITQSDPGLKGDTASGATKPATLETGLVINVPLFIEQGDMVKVDTRTGEYLERIT
jgi:elongation factor P